VVVTLALGIGANAAIFSVVRGVLLRPLVNRGEDRLVYIRQSAPGLGADNFTFSVPEIDDFKSRVTTIGAFGDFSTIGFTMVGLGEPREVRAGVVGGTYFDVMGLRPVLGRLLGPGDDGPNAEGAVVLTHQFWSTSLGSDPGILGKTIRLGSRNATIVGVLEPSIPYPAETEIIANVVTSPHHLSATMVTGRVHRMTELFARLGAIPRPHDRAFLARNLPRLTDVNTQREFYLTDLVVQALEEGKVVVPVVSADPDEVRGINSRRELAEATAILLRAKIGALLDSGVTVVDPGRTYVETEVSVGTDTLIEPGVALLGTTRIGRGVRIQAGCVVENSVVEDGARLQPYSVLSGARVRKGAIVGPFARLRPEADIGEGAHIGNFVEVKKSRLGKGSKANHLAYIGDSLVGKKVNIGAGTITCNYDGIAKHTTVIGDGVFVGSDTQFVAPVTIGKGAVIGAGTTIVKDVPPYALALSRAEQKVLADWVTRKKPELLAKAGLKIPRLPKKEIPK